MKNVKRIFALMLAVIMLLAVMAGCSDAGTSDENDGKNNESSNGNEINDTQEDKYQVKDWVAFMLLSKKPNTLNILYSSGNATDLLTNLTDPLLTCDNYGAIIPCVAEEWGTEDGGLTWTFKLRDNATWVDYQGNKKADVVAEDWLWGLEWVLNFHKNEAVNASTPCTFIAGAQDYYDYTKDLSKEEAEALDLTKFKEMVGVEAVDEHTLVYTCVQQTPYFDSLATSACLYPLPADYVQSVSVDECRAPTYDSRWYSGPYTMTTYVDGNEAVLTKNDSWWGLEDNFVFDTYTMKYVESDDVAYQLYQSGEVYQISLSDAAATSINSNPSDPDYGKIVMTTPYFTSKQMYFNYAKNNEDGTPDTNWNTAIGNEAFRLSMYYGLDLIDWLATTNSLAPYSIQNTTFMVSNICTLSDGTDYNDLVKDMLGFDYSNADTEFVRLDTEKAEQYKQQAIDELTEKGVTFPVELDYYIMGSSSTALDGANVLKSVFDKCLGEDYIKFNIKTYVSSATQEVRAPSLASIEFSGWSGDYADPGAYLLEMSMTNDAAYYPLNVEHLYSENVDPDALALFEEYTEMVDAANAECMDMDKRYEMFADAEYFLLSHALMIPNSQNIDLELSWANAYSKVHAAFGSQNFRVVNWETKIGGYTTDEFYENKAAWEAGLGK